MPSKKNYGITIKDEENIKFLTEYEKAQDSAHHYDYLQWTSMGFFF